MAVIRSGQFFLIGALILASMLAGFILFQQGGDVIAPAIQPAKGLFDKAFDEFPVVVNTAVATNRSIDSVERHLQSYMAFQSRTYDTHALQNRHHALVGIPNGTGVTVVLANFRGTAMSDVAVTVAGTTRTIGTLPAGETAQAGFTGAPQRFSVTLAFEADISVERTFRASRDNLFALYSLRLTGERQRWERTQRY